MSKISAINYNIMKDFGYTDALNGFICSNPCVDSSAFIIETPTTATEILESENSINYTLLHSHIKWRRWDAALDRLTNFPQESSKWIFQKDEDGTVLKYLPLHLVCREAQRQCQLVELLINIYPVAVRTKDHAGRLPLHLFCLGSTENPMKTCFQKKIDEVRNIMVLILSVFPEGMYTKDNQQSTPMKIVTDAVNRSGRTVITDTIVAALTNCHVLLEKQKRVKDEQLRSLQSISNVSSEDTNMDQDKDSVTESVFCATSKDKQIFVHIEDVGSDERNMERDQDHVTGSVFTAASKEEPQFSHLTDPVENDSRQHGALLASNKMRKTMAFPSLPVSNQVEEIGISETLFEGALDYMRLNEIFDPSEGRIMAEGGLLEEVTILRSKLFEREAAYRDATDMIKTLSFSEKMYKSTIRHLQTELNNETTSRSPEYDKHVEELTGTIERMKAVQNKDSQTISELDNELNQANQERFDYKSIVKELKKENKHFRKEAMKASKQEEHLRNEIARLHDEYIQRIGASELFESTDKLLKERVAAMESNEMSLLFRISELECEHSAALLQVQSVGRCNHDIIALKSEVSKFSWLVKEASEEFSMQNNEIEADRSSIVAAVSGMHHKIDRDREVIMNLSTVNFSHPKSEENIGLQLEGALTNVSALSNVNETDEELCFVVKQLNDLIASRERDRENYTQKLDELASQKDFTEKENARLRREIEGISISPKHVAGNHYFGADEETESLKSCTKDLHEKKRKEFLEDKNRQLKKALIHARNEHNASMEVLMIENDELRKLNEHMTATMHVERGANSYYKDPKEENSAVRRRSHHRSKTQWNEY